MKSKTFPKDTFLYKLLAWPNDYLSAYRAPKDICELRQTVILKLTGLVIACLTLFFYTSSITYFFLAQLGRHFEFFSGWTYNQFAEFGGVLFFLTVLFSTIFGLMLGFHFAVKKYQAYRELHGEPPQKPDGVLKSMYKSWKEKLCYEVEFK